MATYTLDWSVTDLGGSAVVSYAAGAILDFTDKPAGATAALSLTANQGDSANVTIAEFEIETSGSSVMTFDYHTSSESGWDKLHIDVDGVSQANFSGATAWTSHAGINIASAGVHTIRFRYQKDGAGNTDQDRVWVALLNITNTVTVNDAAGTVDTYDMEDGAIPAACSTSTWTNSTSEPIAGTRSLRSPASTAGSGSYDLDIAQGASSDYTVVAFNWKVSSEFNWDELYIFPDASAGNVPASGAPSSAGSPGWLERSGTASGRLGIIVPAAGRTLRLRYAKDGGGDAGSDAAWIDSLAMPASSGAGYDKTPADAEGITDARTVTQALARTQADAVGATDARTVAQGLARTQADPLGLTDAHAVAQAIVRAPADALGIADAVDAVLAGDGEQTPEDTVGLTDAVTYVVTSERTITDALGITDTDSPIVLEYGEEYDEPVGLTDTTAVAQGRVVTIGDSIGLVDTATPAGEGDETATPADDVGATDAVATVGDWTRGPSDTAGLTDTAGAVATLVRATADPVGLTDSVTVAIERMVDVVDAIGADDVVARILGLIVTPAARTLVVPAETRVLTVPTQNRTMEA